MCVCVSYPELSASSPLITWTTYSLRQIYAEYHISKLAKEDRKQVLPISNTLANLVIKIISSPVLKLLPGGPISLQFLKRYGQGVTRNVPVHIEIGANKLIACRYKTEKQVKITYSATPVHVFQTPLYRYKM